MKLLFVICMLATCASASAQQVYKCVKGKDVSYQSSPCEASATVAKQWAATPEAAPDNAELWRRYNTRKQGEADSAYLRSLAGRARTGSGQGTAIGTTQSDNACVSAKKYRQSILDQVGINRTHDLLRSLDQRVNQACK